MGYMRVDMDRLEQTCYNTGMGKPYTLLEILPDGTERRQYENGDIRNQNGQLLELGTQLENHLITSDTARDYHQMRKAKMLAAIEAGVMRVTDAPNPAEAAGHIVAKRAEVALRDNGRAGNEAAKIVLAAMDALQDKRQETTHTERHEYTLDTETMDTIAKMIAVRNGDEIIDAE